MTKDTLTSEEAALIFAFKKMDADIQGCILRACQMAAARSAKAKAPRLSLIIGGRPPSAAVLGMDL